MTKLDIRIIPDPVLRQTAAPVAAVDKQIAKQMDDMLETMYAGKGIGLAATQVGLLNRVIVIDVSTKEKKSDPLLIANPEITWQSDDTFTYSEGCLSIPDQYAEVTRPRKIRLGYLDKDGKSCALEAEDLLSICIQHEIDHLNGVLFIDYLSTLKRNMIIRKVEKAKRLGGDG
ncbi:MAG: peptide deformylase [Alphaproteobacteria bacterium]|nr:peptide deformylase [Alphaproteobacteria bacterium]